MTIFDEKKYAERILKQKEYGTLKNQGREKCVLVRYFYNQGYSHDEIVHALLKLNMHNDTTYLSKDKLKIIYERIIDKALKYDLIYDIKVDIYKSEVDIINSIDDELEKKLLFIYLVYYKWASQVSYLRFYSKKNNIMIVVNNDKDIWKIAGLDKLRLKDRYVLSGNLLKQGLYAEDNFKKYNYFYIPFATDSGDLAFTITNYDNLFGELELYNGDVSLIRCSNCGVVMKKINNKHKYCNFCARIINIEKTKQRKLK